MEDHEKSLHCTVASIIPWDLYEEKPGLYPGRFKIPQSDGKIPSVIHISNKTIHYVYLDEARGSLQARDPSDEVAASIVRDYINSQLVIGETARPGLFWLPGYLEAMELVEKHPNLVKTNQTLQNNWFLNLCRLADDDWTRYRKHTVISDFQRVAANQIGWNPDEHEWMRAQVIEQKETEVGPLCVACQSPVTAKTIICPQCRCILLPEEYKKLTFANV